MEPPVSTHVDIGGVGAVSRFEGGCWFARARVTFSLTYGIVWEIGSTNVEEGYIMFQAIFALFATTLNAWLVINEVSKGRDKWSNACLIVFLFSLSASASGLVRAVMLMG